MPKRRPDIELDDDAEGILAIPASLLAVVLIFLFGVLELGRPGNHGSRAEKPISELKPANRTLD